ncbi:hypothetical protein GCM10023340_41590 [Nocardioides marinquilinus]|uniref:non-specific serine/threonine protein kinase n=1 Tax=Nocardioides marinquilinus TaxID=1210400 RepID=A0ABP9Q1X0_9ACTN
MGEVFAGRYELLDPVATGGMGTIWRVHDRDDGEVKAAKILRQSDAASLLRFMREQSMRIDHTHVVTPLGWAGMDDRVLFTMPLVRGGSVADLVHERGPLPVRWVATLTDQLLQALEAVHGAGIVHRDVKPGNLLLDPHDPAVGDVPHLRLTDFGIAAPVDQPRMTQASMSFGTPGYMAPEQWHGADPDPRADLFSVGRVALEMLTGERPPASTEPDLDALRTGERERDALLDLVAAATPADVQRRPESASALRRMLTASGLLDLTQAHDEPTVPDRFSAAPTAGLVRPGPPPSTPPPSAPPAPPMTRVNTGEGPRPAPTPRGGRPSAVPGVLLLLVGLVALVVAAFLLLG